MSAAPDAGGPFGPSASGADSVIPIWRVPQRHAMRLDRRKLACCSLVRCQIWNETGMQRGRITNLQRLLTFYCL